MTNWPLAFACKWLRALCTFTRNLHQFFFNLQVYTDGSADDLKQLYRTLLRRPKYNPELLPVPIGGEDSNITVHFSVHLHEVEQLDHVHGRLTAQLHIHMVSISTCNYRPCNREIIHLVVSVCLSLFCLSVCGLLLERLTLAFGVSPDEHV